MSSRFQNSLWTVVALLLLAASAWAQGMYSGAGGIMSPSANVKPPGLKNVGIEQKLNQQLPLNLMFRDETGKAVKLGDYFGKKPVILSLVYYRCPMLCSELLSGLEGSLKALSFDVGKDFDIVTVSFDPKDTPADATEKKASVLKHYQRAGAAEGWHFLTGSQDSITALTSAVGFSYDYDAQSGQFAHTTAIMLITPEGKIAQYYYGVEFSPKDLRLAMVQASQNKIGSLVDQMLLYCYHYDPSVGRYSVLVLRVLRLAGVATMLLLGGFMLMMFRHDAAQRRSGTERTH